MSYYLANLSSFMKLQEVPVWNSVTLDDIRPLDEQFDKMADNLDSLGNTSEADNIRREKEGLYDEFIENLQKDINSINSDAEDEEETGDNMGINDLAEEAPQEDK